jgi:hypothetical protein
MTALLPVRPVLGGRMIECREINEVNGEEFYWLTAYDARLKKYYFWGFNPRFGTGEMTGAWDESKQTLSWKSRDNTLEGRWTFRSDDEREVPYTVRDRKGNVLVEYAGVSRRIKPRPFCLRSKDRADEQCFNTLKEAIAAAGAGDTIEIHGNGPFISSFLQIKENKPLRIRAADGYRPVISFQHEPIEQHWFGLVRVEAPLVLEGIELRYARPEKGGVIQMFLVTSDLRMTHCGVVTQGEANPIFLSHGSVELHRCGILGLNWPGIRWNFEAAAKLVLNESLLGGCNLLCCHAHAVREKMHELDVRFHRCTVVVEGAIMVLMLNQLLPEPEAGQKPIRIHASESVFAPLSPSSGMVYVDCNVPQYQQTAVTRALLAKAMSWAGENNLYPPGPLIALGSWKQNRLLPNGSFCANLNEWSQLWGIPPTKSVQGTARFQEGNILAKVQSDIHAIRPSDLRLARGSPGQGLGADVDLVGPGDAYQRWKQSPAYQEWRRQTDALLSSAAKAP